MAKQVMVTGIRKVKVVETRTNKDLAGGLWMVTDFITGIVPATHPILG